MKNILLIYGNSIGLNCNSNQENFLWSISQTRILGEKMANGGIEPRTVTLSQPRRSGPLYIPVENAICKSQISGGQHWIVLMEKS